MKSALSTRVLLVLACLFSCVGARADSPDDNACANLAGGPYTIKSKGSALFAARETYTTTISFSEGGAIVDVDSDWGRDWKLSFDGGLHSLTQAIDTSTWPTYDTNMAAHDYSMTFGNMTYDTYVSRAIVRLTKLRQLVIKEQTAPEARSALDCALKKLTAEEYYGRNLAIELDRKIQELKANVKTVQTTTPPLVQDSGGGNGSQQPAK